MEVSNIVKEKDMLTFCTLCEATSLCGVIKTGENYLFCCLIGENDIQN